MNNMTNDDSHVGISVFCITKKTASFASWQRALGVSGNREEYDRLVAALDLAHPAQPDLARTVDRDVERTFFDAAQRVPLTQFLNVVINEFRDYHQGLGYIGSFLLLVLDAPTVLAMLRKLNAHPDFLPGYWKHEAVALATDAHVFNHLLEQREPDVAKHLAAKFVFADTFCQKWFACLNVHLLSFTLLCDFLDVFFRHGFRASMQFGLVLCHELRADILEQKSSDKIFELLRFQPPRVAPERQAAIVRRVADSFAAPNSAPFADVDFAALRRTMYDLKLRARMEAAAKAGVGRAGESDDDADDDDDDSELEEGNECGLCAGMPDYYCVVCKFAVCGLCHKTGSAPHAKAHKVEEFDFDNAVHTAAPNKDEIDGGGKDNDDDGDDDDNGDADDLTEKMASLNI
jgi:hypothetical protein